MRSSPPRILVTRSPHQASELADALRALGAEPVLIPTIETVEPTSYAPLDEALARLDGFDWLIFTSANAVEAFARRLDGRALPVGLKIAAIGAATARALEAAGFGVDLVPALAVAESLTEALLPFALQPDGTPTRFLLIRAEEAREHLPETLRAAGAEVAVAPAYKTVTPAGSVGALRRLFAEAPPDAVTFTSSSTARNLFALLSEAGVEMPESVVRASIGPITSLTLKELGYPAHVESKVSTVDKLAEALVFYLRLKNSP